MNRNYLNGLCFFAKKRGYQNLPVEEVLHLFKASLIERKGYKRPKIKAERIKYPKLPLTWVQMDWMLKSILTRKDAIAEMLKKFGISADICIGGSLSLKYQVPEMRDRNFHDVDLIISPASEDDRAKLKDFLHLMVKAGLATNCSHYYTLESASYHMGTLHLCGKQCPVNILIDKNICLPFRCTDIFNAPSEVIQAKLEYNKGSRAKRSKDLIDLYLMNVQTSGK